MHGQRRVVGWIGCVLAGSVIASLTGCIHAKAPEHINVNLGGRPSPVDSRVVPHPTTLAEAQQELEKAYRDMRYLEQDNARLARKADEYERERDDARKQLKKLKKD